MRTDILERKDEILQWIDNHESKAFICRKLQCKPDTLNAYLQKMNILYDGNQGLRGKTADEKNIHYISAEKYSHSTSMHSRIMKKKLIEEGLREDKCEICGVSIWQGVKLPLEIHHKDGNHFNNNLDNLQILCPNCHSIQEGNSGANIGKYTKKAE